MLNNPAFPQEVQQWKDKKRNKKKKCPPYFLCYVRLAGAVQRGNGKLLLRPLPLVFLRPGGLLSKTNIFESVAFRIFIYVFFLSKDINIRYVWLTVISKRFIAFIRGRKTKNKPPAGSRPNVESVKEIDNCGLFERLKRCLVKTLLARSRGQVANWRDSVIFLVVFENDCYSCLVDHFSIVYFRGAPVARNKRTSSPSMRMQLRTLLYSHRWCQSIPDLGKAEGLASIPSEALQTSVLQKAEQGFAGPGQENWHAADR